MRERSMLPKGRDRLFDAKIHPENGTQTLFVASDAGEIRLIFVPPSGGGMEMKMKLLILNGPNLNMLGIREPDIYGRETYATLIDKIECHAKSIGVEVVCKQSNHEGVLLDEIQAAYGKMDGIVINPGAYTHTSIALLDALKAVGLPTVEVHISAVEEREAFRQVSYIRAACVATITGQGTDGYLQAMDLLLARGQA